MKAQTVTVAVYDDGSRIVRDESGDWQCNIATTLEGPDGALIWRGPEWTCRLRARRRGLTIATG
jgi:hypothetical protein